MAAINHSQVTGLWLGWPHYHILSIILINVSVGMGKSAQTSKPDCSDTNDRNHLSVPGPGSLDPANVHQMPVEPTFSTGMIPSFTLWTSQFMVFSMSKKCILPILPVNSQVAVVKLTMARMGKSTMVRCQLWNAWPRGVLWATRLLAVPWGKWWPWDPGNWNLLRGKWWENDGKMIDKLD